MINPETFKCEYDASTRRGTIRIYDYIGWGGIEATSFIEELKQMKGASDIDIYINSPGGVVFDAVTIYNELKGFGATINIIVMGYAASAASIIAMAGDNITMRLGSWMMIHNAIGYTVGNASAHMATASLLDKMDNETLVAIYSEKTGRNKKEIADLMADETWMSAQEAVDLGFADKCDGGKEDDDKESVAKAKVKEMFHNQIAAKIAALYFKPQNAYERKEKEMDEKTKTPATIAEIKAACLNAPAEFILRHIECLSDIDAVVSAWKDEQIKQAKFEADAAKMELAKLKADKSSPKEERAGNDPIASEPKIEKPSMTANELFNARVKEIMAGGKTKAKAIREIATKEPEIHAAFIAEYNETHK